MELILRELSVDPPRFDAYDMTVPEQAVLLAIDVLRHYLASWKRPAGVRGEEAQDRAQFAMARDAALALAGLIEGLWATTERGDVGHDASE